MPSFLKRFETTPLGEVFQDQSAVSAFDESLGWLSLPDADFLRYIQSLEPAPYDIRIDPSDTFRPGATFLSSQSHRVWLTLRLIDRYLPHEDTAVLLDLGAYPFAIDSAVRHFLRRNCRIVATIAQELGADAIDALAKDRIELLPVNLDPLVKMENPLPGMTEELPLADNSVDVVLFAHVIEHLYHPIQILKEIARVLKPGGKLIITTDHGFLLGGLLNYLNDGEFVHEPVDSSAAMVFHKWRGHVRFYSDGDLRKLIAASGLQMVQSSLEEVLYNSVPQDHFVKPNVDMPRWRANLLTEFPAYRNEIMLVAQKEQPDLNPFEQRWQHDGRALGDEFRAGECALGRSTLTDFVFGYRLFLGRWPTPAEISQYEAAPPPRGVDGLVDQLLSSPEFAARPLAAHLERPGASCLVMTETPEGHRYFFSAQDTFVGFPVAVGVFERDVTASLAQLLQKDWHCIDVGANFGYYSIRMAAAVGPAGRVYSFEPEPFNYSLLLRNRAENKFDSMIEAFPFACGEEEGEAILRKHPNAANFGGSYLSPGAAGSPGEIRVPVRRVDSVIGPEVHIDLVKIDAEGFEPFVLRGMREILTRCRPVIVCEFSTEALNRQGQHAATQLLEELAALGYLLYEAAGFAAGSRQLFEYNGGVCFVNLVCLPAPDSARG